MELVPEGESFDFASDLFPKLMDAGEEIHGAVMPGYWCDVGTPRAYFQCCLDALDGALRLPDAPFEKTAPAAHAERSPLEGRARTERRVACRDRAKRVSPAPDADELCIETAADDEDFSGRLADALGDMVQRLESGAEEGEK